MKPTVTDLLAIAEKAIEVRRLERVALEASRDLGAACRRFRDTACQGDYIQPGTELFDSMLVATSTEKAIADEAKRAERNARKRLNNAIDKAAGGEQ